VESGGFAFSVFWRVRTEGLTRSVQSVAGRDQNKLPSHLGGKTSFMCFPAVAPLWGGCNDIGGRGGGRGRTHLRGGEGGRLPECCRAPQVGATPLHHAAGKGHAAVAKQLLAAGATADAKNYVRREWGADRGGLCGRRKLCVSS